jgi:hypothetical protein
MEHYTRITDTKLKYLESCLLWPTILHATQSRYSRDAFHQFTEILGMAYGQPALYHFREHILEITVCGNS